MPNTQELLARFHHALVVEIRKSRPDYLHAPFTVAEIYQNLVPYRSHRDVIGVEMNGDYEDALLRLLAGEGDYLVLESEVARREIRDELQTGNPNTGLFRDFAAADVKLNPEKLDDISRPIGGCKISLRGVSANRMVSAYTLYSLQQALDHLAGLDDSDRERATSAVADTGWAELLAYQPRHRVKKDGFKLVLDKSQTRAKLTLKAKLRGRIEDKKPRNAKYKLKLEGIVGVIE